MTVRETKKFGSISKNIIKLLHKNKIQHILTISSLSLPRETKKLTLTLTITILMTHIWKTVNKLQFDDTIIPASNVIINIKNELKNILTHYKHNTINNTLHEFPKQFCINNALCKLTQNSITILKKLHHKFKSTYLTCQNKIRQRRLCVTFFKPQAEKPNKII